MQSFVWKLYYSFQFICLLACLLLLTLGFYGPFWCNRIARKILTWHQIRLKRRRIMKRNKCLLSATARHAGTRPSEQFVVSFFTDYLKKKRVSLTQGRVLLALN